MKKTILIILIVIFLIIFGFSAYKLTEILREYNLGEEVYEEMEVYVSIPETTQPPETSQPPETTVPEETETTEPAEALPFPAVDFEALLEENDDVVGWIYIPDTKINYPVLQGRDNEQYLRHMINGKYNTAGSIFLDAYVPNAFMAQNNPVYGHRMKNGTMFADIAKYRTQKYYDQHPKGYLVTPDGNYLLHIFSGYVTGTSGNAWEIGFSEDEFSKWLKDVQKKSCFTTEVVPTVEDRIVTFSTCTYERENARFVVHAVMEELES